MNIENEGVRKTVENPHGLNSVALAVLEFCNGDARTKKGDCPICHKHALTVDNGDKWPFIVYCHYCNDGKKVHAYLASQRFCPTSVRLAPEHSSLIAEQARTEEERKRYALSIWNRLRRTYGRQYAVLLNEYLSRRGIKKVPSTSLITLPPDFLQFFLQFDECTYKSSHDPGWVLPIRDYTGRFQGICVVWLSPDLKSKRENEPKKQTYGLLKHNFIQCTELDWTEPPPKLCVAEGPETALAMAQLTGLPAVAVGGQTNFENVILPHCPEYILAPDHSDSGASRKWVGKLATKLIGNVTVRIALPDKPEGGKSGFDWNDALMDANDDEDKQAELGRAILEAPLFETVMTDEEDREVRLNALAATKQDDPLSYEQDRAGAAKELNLRVKVLDAEVDKRLLKLRPPQSEPPPPNMELLAASAREIIASDDVLGLFAEEFCKAVVGESKNAKILYLTGTTRLFDKAMHAAIKGPSSAGKSEVRKHVLNFFPPESVISFTALSEKALLYYKDDFKHKILSMGEAQSREESAFQDYLLRELMSEGKLCYPVVQKVAGHLVTTTIEKNGPVAFMVTTTRHQLNPENETRMLSLEVNESEEQTQKVLVKIAEVEGLNRNKINGEFRQWHDYQRWLAAGERRVYIPFAKTLSKLIKATRSVRLRRDYGQLQRAIKAHALLHREHRKVTREGIIATITGDYAVIRELMGDTLSTASEIKVAKNILETVEAVNELARGRDGAKARMIADKLGMDKSTVYRRLRAAEDAGYVINLEEKKGRAGRYICAEEKPPKSSELLPTVDELVEAYKLSRSTAPTTKTAPERVQERNVQG